MFVEAKENVQGDDSRSRFQSCLHVYHFQQTSILIFDNLPFSFSFHFCTVREIALVWHFFLPFFSLACGRGFQF
jgi:hypothetical protein